MEPNTNVTTEITPVPFDNLKEDIVVRCKKHGACSGEFRRIIESENNQQLLQVLKDNMYWCLNNKMIDADYLEKSFGKELLWQNHIYTSGTNSVRLSEAKAVVISLGSSQNTIKSLDSSQNTIESWDSSQNTAVVGASSSAHIADYNSTKTKYELTEGDCPLIKHLTEKKVYVKTSAFAIQQIN